MTRPGLPALESPEPTAQTPASRSLPKTEVPPTRGHQPRRPRGTGRLANEAWEAVLVAHATFLRELAATGIWHEVSMREYDVLYTLSKCHPPVRQRELEGHVLLSQPAISRLISRLVRRGLIVRSADPADGRGVRLALTEAGRAAQRRIGARHALDVSRAMAARLDPSEMEQLRCLVSKLAAPHETQEGGS